MVRVKLLKSMSHDKQDKRIVETRSKIGSMSFGEIRKFIGVDTDSDGLIQESGTPTNPDGGVRNNS